MHYEQFSNSRNRPLSKYSIENTTPIPLTSSIGVDTSGITKKRYSAETANAAILSRKRRTITKLNHRLISNENHKQGLSSDRINQSSSNIVIDQIDDELLKRLSQGKKKLI
jgi:ABC-type molybdenum transport system ATPase subunit/photorepair protein PhrA